MNKKQQNHLAEKSYIKLLQKHGGYNTDREVEQALSSVIDSLREAMISRKSVYLEGLGIFESREFVGHVCGVPGHTKTYLRSPDYILHFKVDETLKTKVNGGVKVIMHVYDEKNGISIYEKYCNKHKEIYDKLKNN